MNKQSFLEQLTFQLKGIPWPEIEKHRGYYEEMLDDMLEDGMTEEQAVEKLGDPAKIAAQILQEPGVSRVVIQPQAGTARAYETGAARTKPKNQTGWKVVTAVLLILAAPIWVPLALSVVSAVLSVYLTLWAIVLAIYAVTAALLIGGGAAVVAGAIHLPAGPAGGIAAIGLGLVLVALGLLAILVSYYATLGLTRGTAWVWRKCTQGFGRRGGK